MPEMMVMMSVNSNAGHPCSVKENKKNKFQWIPARFKT